MSKDIRDLFHRKAVIINDSMYFVEKLPEGNTLEMRPEMFKKQVAYEFVSFLSHWVLPYRGTVPEADMKKFNAADDNPVGIWFVEKSNDKYHMFVTYPRTKKDQKAYDISNVRDIMTATFNNEYNPDQFIDYCTSSDIGADAFIPPLYPDDDALNKIMKTGIRLKAAPFEPYGKRLEASAAEQHGSEGTNNKNNNKRAIIKNTSMSASKFLYYADVWQLDCAIILRDRPGAMHPMFDKDDKKMLILYPSGIPFDINPKNLINITNMVSEGIAENKKRNNNDDDDD